MKLKEHFFLRNTFKKFAFSRSFCLFTLLIVFGAFTNIYSQTVSITASQPNANEQGPVNGQFTISVTGAGGLGGSVQVFLSVDGASTATADDDYNALPLSVNVGTFLGSGSAQVNLNVVDDNLIEGTENIIWTIDNDLSYAIGVGSATVNIADNDVAGFTINESGGNTTTSEPDGTDSFTVLLNAQPTSNVVLNVASSDTGEGTVAPASLTFTPANYNTPQNVTVTGVNDAIVDGPQSYNITISVNDGASDDDFDAVPNQVINATNSDDDTATLTIEDVQAIEGASMQFIVTLNTAVAGGPFDVDVDFNDGTAEGGGPPLAFPDDYNDDTQTITFNGTAGEQRQFNVQVLTDNVIEADETFTVELSSDNPLVDDSDTAIGTILNDDVGSVTVVTDPLRLTTDEEGGEGGNNGRFEINLSQPNTTGSNIIVSYSLGGTATSTGAGQDYNVNGTIWSSDFWK